MKKALFNVLYSIFILLTVLSFVFMIMALRKEKLITDDTKVIALTANAISGAEEMYINNGFDSLSYKAH